MVEILLRTLWKIGEVVSPGYWVKYGIFDRNLKDTLNLFESIDGNFNG